MSSSLRSRLFLAPAAAGRVGCMFHGHDRMVSEVYRCARMLREKNIEAYRAREIGQRPESAALEEEASGLARWFQVRRSLLEAAAKMVLRR